MSVKKSTRKAGRPENAGMSAESIKTKIDWELTKARKNSANNLGKYFAILEGYALGTAKGCSPTNQVSSCKMFIDMAQDYLETQEEEQPDAEQDLPIEEKQVANGSPVKSFAEKKAEYEAKKAAERGEC